MPFSTVINTVGLPYRVSFSFSADRGSVRLVELVAPARVPVLRHRLDARPVHDVEDGHRGGVLQLGEQLGCEQEALRRVRAAGGFHHFGEDLALVHRVHALVDLVHHAEGAFGELLQRDQVQHGAHGALPARLAVRAERLQLLLSPELNPNAHLVLVKVLVLYQTHLPHTPNGLEAFCKRASHLIHHLLQLRQPLGLSFVDLALSVVEEVVLLLDCNCQLVDLLLAVLIILEHVRVADEHLLHLSLHFADGLVDLLHLAGHSRELGLQGVVRQLGYALRLNLELHRMILVLRPLAVQPLHLNVQLLALRL
mmetsp:Transcript_2834/g.4772  ORF Transcript_2834/g.4772 Transcript_2834/m.4772 type:complete len:310 (-) Transcript_2834:2646-3575(-)